MTLPSNESLDGLIERLEKAAGPDRDLDRDIAVACGLGQVSQFGIGYIEDDRAHDVVERLTASTYAALALCERLLPGWVCETLGQDAVSSLGEMKGIGWTAEFSNGLNTCQGQAPTLPLAILLTLLHSLKDNPHG